MKRLGTALFAAVALVVLCLFAAPAGAQPFNIWLVLPGPTSGYTEVPHNAALNPTSAITIEGWVSVTDPTGGGCSSIIGKNWTRAWWVGICGTTLRSFLFGYPPSGTGPLRDGGTLSGWTHFAVVYDGSHRYHYINGELVNSWAETGALPGTTDALRIGSDVSYVHTPAGSVNELRLWNVARTQAQIRQTINVPITTAQPGLVAVWSDGRHDALHHYDGVAGGTGTGFLTFPAGPVSCGTSTANNLCLQTRFSITTKWRTNPAPGTPTDGSGHVVVFGPNSGIFWFFSSDNWEVMVKAINACALNNRYWIFSAATTNVFYRMEVFDYKGIRNKIYFNYPGPPAPAVTDVDAFATCP